MKTSEQLSQEIKDCDKIVQAIGTVSPPELYHGNWEFNFSQGARTIPITLPSELVRTGTHTEILAAVLKQVENDRSRIEIGSKD